MQTIRICAHAGAEGTPADSLATIAAAAAAGAAWVELDLRFTPEGVAVLAHDELGRRTLADLVTVDQALDELARYPDLGVNVDVKELDNLVRFPHRLTQGELPNPVYFTGMKRYQLPSFRGVCPSLAATCDDLPRWFFWKSAAAQIQALRTLKAEGVLALNLSYRLVDQRLMAASRAADLPVRVWTVDREDDMERMIALGVEAITTNRVAVLKDMLADLAKPRSSR